MIWWEEDVGGVVGVEVGTDVVVRGEGIPADDADLHAGEVVLLAEFGDPGVLVSEVTFLTGSGGGRFDLCVGLEVRDGEVPGREDEVRGVGVDLGEGVFDVVHGHNLDGIGALVRVDQVDGLYRDAQVESQLQEPEGGIPAGGP